MQGRYALKFAILILLASVSLNVFLARKVRSFGHLASLGPPRPVLKVGTAVPPIMVTGLDGRRELISYQATNEPTVLHVLTPSCVWCARNMDNLKTLLTKQSGAYRFIGLSLSEEGLADYVTKNGLNLPIYTRVPPDARNAYMLGVTPQTIVVSRAGQVLQSWIGAYVGDQKSQVESFFHVSLPGLRELPKAEKKATN